MTCPVCGSADTIVFDRRPRVPVHQNGLCPTRQSALATPTGVLEMAGCRACGFAWNAAFEPDRLVYDAT